MDGVGLSRELLAMRLAREIEEGWYVNLGMGLPTMVGNYMPDDREAFLHSENGILNYGGVPADESQWDYDLLNPSGQPVELKRGACFFDSAAAFGMIRGGHVDLAVLGAYQVSETGDLANWATDVEIKGMGGAMDLCCGVKRIFVIMGHTTNSGRPKIVRRCIFPLTAKGVVSVIFTNLAVIDVHPEGLWLRELAPGVTPEEVQAVTEPRLRMDLARLKEMAL